METIVLSCWVDLDEHEYCVNINNGPVPDVTFASYDEMDAYVKGFRECARIANINVTVILPE